MASRVALLTAFVKLALGLVIGIMALTLLAAVLTFAFVQYASQVGKETYSERLLAREQDPFLGRIITENAQICDKDTPYVWVCGAVIALPGQTNNCSTPERPSYSGSLGQPFTGDYMRDRDVFMGLHGISDFEILPANVAWFSPGQAKALAAGPLPDAPQFDREDVWTQLEWAIYRNIPVRFYKQMTYAIAAIPNEADQRAAWGAVGAYVSFRHPDLPIVIRKYMPVDPPSNWQSFVDRAIPTVSAAVRSYDPSASCGHPPETLRFQADNYDEKLYDSLLAWKRTKSAAP